MSMNFSFFLEIENWWIWIVEASVMYIRNLHIWGVSTCRSVVCTLILFYFSHLILIMEIYGAIGENIMVD